MSRLLATIGIAVAAVSVTWVQCVPLAQAPSAAECALPNPSLLRAEGNTRLEMWELPVTAVWFSDSLPAQPDYLRYHATMSQTAGVEQLRPLADPPQPKDAAERELWRREAANEELMYSGGGRVRRIQCLEAALFARQHARYSQLTHPTEFVAQVLRRADRLKVYSGASDQMYPPKSVYGLNEVTADVADGWQYLAVLHNHTIRMLNGAPALGVAAPSTSDVELFNGLVKTLGLREVRVTNGVLTGVVPAENLFRFSVR